MHKIAALSCSLVLALAWQAPAPAQGSVALDTANGFEAGGQLSRYRYREPGLMNLKGAKLGATGSATRKFGGPWHGTGEARLAIGEVDYSGSGKKKNNPDGLLELRITVGRDVRLEDAVLAPYSGLGFRTLYNDLRGETSTDAIGYRRVSRYWYLPLGVTHRFKVDAASRISTSLEYDHLLYGTQKTYLSDVADGFNNPVNEQQKGYGLRVATAYERRSWSAGLFYSFWKISRSENKRVRLFGAPSTLVVYEPRNTTNELGLQVKYRF